MMRHLALVSGDKGGLLTPTSCRRMDCAVTLIAERPVAGCENPDGFVRVDDLLSSEDVLKAVKRYHAKRPLGAVLAHDEYAVEPAALLAASLGLPGLTSSAATAARDKLVMRRRLATAGIAVPEWRAVSTFEQALAAAAELRFPVIVKPRRLSGAVGVIRVDSIAELREAWVIVQTLTAQEHRHAGTADSALIEEYVDGYDFTVELLAVEGQTFPIAVVDKPDPARGPHFDQGLFITPSRAPPEIQEMLVDTAAAAMAAVGITHGPAHVEVRIPLSGSTPVVIELAARNGGSRDILLRLAKDLDLARLTVDAAFRGVPSGLRPWTEGVAFCAIRGLSIRRAGTVVGISGVDDARGLPNIQAIDLRVRLGSVVYPYPYANAKLGPIIGVGSDYDDVRTAVNRAHGLITIEVDNVER
jgi:biotin carboxylase